MMGALHDSTELQTHAGSAVRLDDSASQENQDHKIERNDLIRIGLVVVAVILCWLRVFEPVAQFDLIGFAATLIGGYPIFKEAFHNLRERRMTMELSMSLALLAALAISEVFTALVITLFVLVAETLEKLTMDRGRNAIRSLLSMLPEKAFIRKADAVEERILSLIQIGDVVVVKPGSRVPVDGVVISGHSFIDQASITGESLPSEKLPGSDVYAGTINQSGTLDVETARIGEDTAFGKIILAVENSEKLQAPVEKIADQLAGYLVYFAIGCALLTFLITHNAKTTISVIIVAGACGIAAGTPLAIWGGVGRAARFGSIIKGGLFLELLSRIDTVVFDKTGTITCGTPEVVSVEGLHGVSKSEVLQLAATAESVSEHPLGKAIVRKAQVCGVTHSRPDQFNYLPGKGITCRIGNEEVLVGNRSLFEQKEYLLDSLSARRPDTSEVLVGRAKKVIGLIQIADLVRPEAKQAVDDLKKMGINSILLTGDAWSIAETISKELAIIDVKAELLPDEKKDHVKKLAAVGMRVAMVGDGVNDAPALMEASVGVAIGSGTDVARESADIVLIGNDLGRFVETVRIARRCRRTIMTNFIGTLVVDGLGVLLAAFGHLSPLLAAFVHVGSELIFILNSARLLPGKLINSTKLSQDQ